MAAVQTVQNIARTALCILALLGAPADAAEPDRIGQTGSAATRLGQRLAALAGRQGETPHTGAFWDAARAAILASDAVEDAAADMAAGHTGFMTYANDTIAERPNAPGIRCFDRTEAGRRAVFRFAYREPLERQQGQSLLAFLTYAQAYNAHVAASGALGETSCAEAGQD